MLANALQLLYAMEISNLINEIKLYSNDKSLWVTEGGVKNSGGNLCQHLIGNLNHFIGATLGQTGYVRNREAEFGEQHKTRTELVHELEATAETVRTILASLTEEDLAKTYPFDFLGTHSTGYYLTRFLSHLSYHLGQINYHRRLLDA